MYFLDYFFIALLLLAIWRGHKRGFVAELQSFIGTVFLITLLSGVWVFTVLKQLVGSLTALHPLTAGVLGLIISLIVAWWLMRFLRVRVPELLGENIDPVMSSTLGMFIGLIRRALLLGFLLWLAVTAPWSGLRSTVTEYSMFAYQLSSMSRVPEPVSVLPKQTQLPDSSKPISEPSAPVDSTEFNNGFY